MVVVEINGWTVRALVLVPRIQRLTRRTGLPWWSSLLHVDGVMVLEQPIISVKVYPGGNATCSDVQVPVPLLQRMASVMMLKITSTGMSPVAKLQPAWKRVL